MAKNECNLFEISVTVNIGFICFLMKFIQQILMSCLLMFKLSCKSLGRFKDEFSINEHICTFTEYWPSHMLMISQHSQGTYYVLIPGKLRHGKIVAFLWHHQRKISLGCGTSHLIPKQQTGQPGSSFCRLPNSFKNTKFSFRLR